MELSAENIDTIVSTFNTVMTLIAGGFAGGYISWKIAEKTREHEICINKLDKNHDIKIKMGESKKQTLLQVSKELSEFNKTLHLLLLEAIEAGAKIELNDENNEDELSQAKDIFRMSELISNFYEMQLELGGIIGPAHLLGDTEIIKRLNVFGNSIGKIGGEVSKNLDDKTFQNITDSISKNSKKSEAAYITIWQKVEEIAKCRYE